jgi:hypothetical protein
MDRHTDAASCIEWPETMTLPMLRSVATDSSLKKDPYIRTSSACTPPSVADSCIFATEGSVELKGHIDGCEAYWAMVPP